MNNIIIATPHRRNDGIQDKIKKLLPHINVIRIDDPKELNIKKIEKLEPDWIFFPHWSWLIPSNIFSNYKCVIFHMTDLPYGRGGSPLQNTILEGLDKTKICAIECEEGLDTGPVYARANLSLEGTAEEILMRANSSITNLIIHIIKDNPKPVPQVGKITLFKRRTPDQSNINNLNTIDEIYNYIRMLDAHDYPHAFLETKSHKYEFTGVKKASDGLIANVKIKIK